MKRRSFLKAMLGAAVVAVIEGTAAKQVAGAVSLVGGAGTDMTLDNLFGMLDEMRNRPVRYPVIIMHLDQFELWQEPLKYETDPTRSAQFMGVSVLQSSRLVGIVTDEP